MRGYNLSDKPPGGQELPPRAAGAGRGAPDPGLRRRDAPWWSVTTGARSWRGWPRCATRGASERLAILNVPHPERFAARAAAARGSCSGALTCSSSRSRGSREGSCGPVTSPSCARALRNDPVRPGTFTDEDIERYVGALARPGALTAALNYYRALSGGIRGARALLRTDRGARDGDLGREGPLPGPGACRSRLPPGSRTPASSACRTPATGSSKTAPKGSTPCCSNSCKGRNRPARRPGLANGRVTCGADQEARTPRRPRRRGGGVLRAMPFGPTTWRRPRCAARRRGSSRRAPRTSCRPSRRRAGR